MRVREAIEQAREDNDSSYISRYKTLWTEPETGIHIPSYQHIERMGHEDVENILHGEVVVQDKMDGANLTVGFVGPSILIASRNNLISLDGSPDHGFNGAIEYIYAHSGIMKYYEDRKHMPDRPHLLLRGEWLVRHTINYTPEAMRHWYVFDMERWMPRIGYENEAGEWQYLHPQVWMPYVEGKGIRVIHNTAILSAPNLDQIIELSKGPDVWGSPAKEGIVIKNYAFKNRWGRVTWGKVVTADFKEAAKLHMGAQKHDAKEVRFVEQSVTQTLVLKNIHKMADESGQPATIGTWLEFWDGHGTMCSVKISGISSRKNVLGTFDFNSASRLAERKTRDIALAFYNGVPLREDADGPYDARTDSGKFSVRPPRFGSGEEAAEAEARDGSEGQESETTAATTGGA